MNQMVIDTFFKTGTIVEGEICGEMIDRLAGMTNIDIVTRFDGDMSGQNPEEDKKSVTEVDGETSDQLAGEPILGMMTYDDGATSDQKQEVDGVCNSIIQSLA